ncbi:hypothetical protein LTS08_007342 [Lithohypha guttulata]|nr:hypothetical protein LTS08_007342 [Lithohypha guttulata]
MVRYTSTILAAASFSLAIAAPAVQQPVCKVVTEVVTGSPIWVTKTADPTTAVSSSGSWSAWDPTTSSKVTTSTKTTTTTKTPTATSSTSSDWAVWTSSANSTSSTSSKTTTTIIWNTSTSSATTTSSKSSTSDTTTTTTTAATTTTTTTTTTATPTPTCPADNGAKFGSSCNCGFSVYSSSRITADLSSASFFEKTPGELVDSLDTCLNYCDENENCKAVVYVNDPAYSSSTQDYLHCWQISGVKGNTVTDGHANIAYKNCCDGTCASSYGA